MLCCKFCNVRMLRSGYEFYCPRCGYVENDYVRFNIKRKGVGMAVPSWKANMKQTRRPFTYMEGRMIITK